MRLEGLQLYKNYKFQAKFKSKQNFYFVHVVRKTLCTMGTALNVFSSWRLGGMNWSFN